MKRNETKRNETFLPFPPKEDEGFLRVGNISGTHWFFGGFWWKKEKSERNIGRTNVVQSQPKENEANRTKNKEKQKKKKEKKKVKKREKKKKERKKESETNTNNWTKEMERDIKDNKIANGLSSLVVTQHDSQCLKSRRKLCLESSGIVASHASFEKNAKKSQKCNE